MTTTLSSIRDEIFEAIEHFIDSKSTCSIHDITRHLRKKYNGDGNDYVSIPHRAVKSEFEQMIDDGTINSKYSYIKTFTGVFFLYEFSRAATVAQDTTASNATIATPKPPRVQPIDNKTIENRIQLYLDNSSKYGRLEVTIKNIQSAIKRGNVSTGISSDEIIRIVSAMGYQVGTQWTTKGNIKVLL